MNTISKVLRNLKIFDEPGFYIVIAVAFFSGIGIAPGLSDRNLSLLIGFFVALTAFIGVVYSKHKELVLKKHEISLQKVEDFSVNLFQWLELMDRLLSETHVLKKESDRNHIIIGMFSKEYQGCRENMTKILTHKGRHLALIALHSDAIINNDTQGLLDSILESQENGMSDIIELLNCGTGRSADIHQQSANAHFSKMRNDAKKLMTQLKVP